MYSPRSSLRNTEAEPDMKDLEYLYLSELLLWLRPLADSDN
jgi:hypothetical protein